MFVATSIIGAQAATKYWDTAAGANNGVGGTGTLTAQTTPLFSNSPTGDTALSAAAITDDGVFQGTAGTVTFGANFTLATATFNVTGYTITNSGSRTFTAPITLASNVNLTLAPPANATLTVSSITGASGSGLTLAGATAAATDTVRVNLQNGSTIASSAPITITTTGSSGLAGFSSSVANATINADITNNTGVPTMIGATSGNVLTLGGALKGSAAVQFSAGSAGGAGTINLNAASTYTGETRFNGTASGAVKLEIDNAIPQGSALVMGFSNANGQKLDLNGRNQTIASLASNTGGTGSIISSAAGAGTDTLTIKGSATTDFALAITDGATRKVALSLDPTNSGILRLTGTNTFSGNTTIGGGTLTAGAVNALQSTNRITASNGGTLLLAGTGNRIGNSVPVTLSGGTFNTDGLVEGAASTPGVGALTLSGGSSSILDFGSGTSLLAFANSSAETWSGSLSVYNYNGNPDTGKGTDQLYFGSSSAGLTTTQLDQIMFFSGAGTGLLGSGGILSDGEVVPLAAVPEPGTIFGGLALLGVVGYRERRRFSSLFTRAMR